MLHVSNTYQMWHWPERYLKLCRGEGGRGWSGGAMGLGKLPGLGRPTNLDFGRARAYCACSRCGWGLFRYCFCLFFLPLSGRRPGIDWNTVSKGRKTHRRRRRWMARGGQAPSIIWEGAQHTLWPPSNPPTFSFNFYVKQEKKCTKLKGKIVINVTLI